jgi:hypothetical protein
MKTFVENFESVADIIREYAITDQAALKQLQESKIHLAWYGHGDYCGASFVLFEHDGVLFEASGSHCSCSGLEGQWVPEQTTWGALNMRSYGESGADEAQAILEALVKEHIN